LPFCLERLGSGEDTRRTTNPADHSMHGQAPRRDRDRTIHLLPVPDRCLNNGVPGGNGARKGAAGSQETGRRTAQPIIGRMAPLLLAALPLTSGSARLDAAFDCIHRASVLTVALAAVIGPRLRRVGTGTQEPRPGGCLLALAWTFDPQNGREPLIPIRNASFAEIGRHRTGRSLVHQTWAINGS
jgi:hypothetical protein